MTQTRDPFAPDGACFIIAEAGVNHNGDAAMALALVDAAADSGADAVKFQTFRASEIASATAAKAEYQRRTTEADESQLSMLRRLELDEDAHHALIARCRQRGIAFLSTPFDLPSLELLTGRLGLSLIKLPSGEITNAPLLHAAARTRARIILSTGMADLGEVEDALGIIAHGLLGGTDPCRRAFAEAWHSEAGRAAVARQVILLHCTTEYPAPFDDVNLRAMDTLARAFGLRAGFSDHTPGIAVAMAAAAMGAVIVEKHFTLDRTLPGPDHKASLEPAELTAMVAGIRAVEAAMGDGVKRPAPSELPNRPIARKSLVARVAISAGEAFTPENLSVKRPGTGIAPTEWWDVLGRTAARDYDADEVITP